MMTELFTVEARAEYDPKTDKLTTQPRTFVLQVTKTTTASIRFSETEARRMFPEAGWDDPQTSHAGNMEDSLDLGSNIPRTLKTRLGAVLRRSDEVEETYELWEV